MTAIMFGLLAVAIVWTGYGIWITVLRIIDIYRNNDAQPRWRNYE